MKASPLIFLALGLHGSLTSAVAQEPPAFTIDVEVRDSYLLTAIEGATVSLFRHGQLVGTTTTGTDGGGSIEVPPVSGEPGALAGGSGLGAVYPNPFSDALRIELETAAARDVAIAVYDLLGRRVVNETVAVGGGPNTLLLDLGYLPAGAYLLGVVVGDEHHSRLVTKTGASAARAPGVSVHEGAAAMRPAGPSADAQNFEIASYRALIAAAEELGEHRVAEICKEILHEEEEMAAWLEHNLPQVTREFLERELAEVESKR